MASRVSQIIRTVRLIGLLDTLVAAGATDAQTLTDLGLAGPAYSPLAWGTPEYTVAENPDAPTPADELGVPPADTGNTGPGITARVISLSKDSNERRDRREAAMATGTAMIMLSMPIGKETTETDRRGMDQRPFFDAIDALDNALDARWIAAEAHELRILTCSNEVQEVEMESGSAALQALFTVTFEAKHTTAGQATAVSQA